MKYEIIRITNSQEDYLRVLKGDAFLNAFWITIKDIHIRSYEEALEIAKEVIHSDLEITQTVYTYEA